MLRYPSHTNLFLRKRLDPVVAVHVVIYVVGGGGVFVDVLRVFEEVHQELLWKRAIAWTSQQHLEAAAGTYIYRVCLLHWKIAPVPVQHPVRVFKRGLI